MRIWWASKNKKEIVVHIGLLGAGSGKLPEPSLHFCFSKAVCQGIATCVFLTVILSLHSCLGLYFNLQSTMSVLAMSFWVLWHLPSLSYFRFLRVKPIIPFLVCQATYGISCSPVCGSLRCTLLCSDS